MTRFVPPCWPIPPGQVRKVKSGLVKLQGESRKGHKRSCKFLSCLSYWNKSVVHYPTKGLSPLKEGSHHPQKVVNNFNKSEWSIARALVLLGGWGTFFYFQVWPSSIQSFIISFSFLLQQICCLCRAHPPWGPPWRCNVPIFDQSKA